MSAVRFGTPPGRWIIAATVLGSGMAFLDGTVVNVALPTIGRDLDTDLAGLQWILDSYLVTLTGLLLLGGSLGDRYGRKRVFMIGLVGFTAASVLCAFAPNVGTLVLFRALQGAAAALLVPGSLALLSASFHPDDRGRAVGAWSALAGVASAVGPFVGGWLVGAVSWRAIFLINVPVGALTLWVTMRHVPESRDDRVHGGVDVAGALTISLGLAALAYAAIEGPAGGSGVVAALLVGVVLIIGFVVTEARRRDPMLPLGLFRSRQFTGANLTTLAVYSGLGAATFLVILQLQLVLGYSPIASGASLLPLTVMMLLLSSRAGALAQRIGPRLPMTVGPIVVGLGMLLYTRVEAGATFVGAVLPAGLVLGLGLALTVAPLTATVLGSVDEGDLGIASGVNNAVARLAGLLAIAVLPGVVGLDTADGDAAGFSEGFQRAMVVSAVLCVAGGVIAFATVRRVRTVEPMMQGLAQPCLDPCIVGAESPA